MTDVENATRVWNRFARDMLKDRAGFRKCLQHTLYRPRDILVLLNGAYVNAARADRTEIVEADIESSAKTISKERLADLIEEYDTVLPGVSLFVRAFEGQPAFATVADILHLWDDMSEKVSFEEIGLGDFTLFSSPEEILSALFSIGFIGFREGGTAGGCLFCHDGSTSEIDPSKREAEAVVHPCYWSALNLRSEAAPEEVAVGVEDDEESSNKQGVSDLRTKLLGQIVSQLPRFLQGLKEANNLKNG